MFKGNIEYYAEEIEINGKFRTFAKNAAIVFAGHNTVTAQLKIKSARGIYCIHTFLLQYKSKFTEKNLKNPFVVLVFFFFNTSIP